MGFQPTGLRHAANTEFLLGLVAAGHDVAFDQGAVARKEPRVVWRPLTAGPLLWRMSAAWPPGRAHRSARLFAEVAARVLASTGAPAGAPSDPETPRPWNVLFPERLPGP